MTQQTSKLPSKRQRFFNYWGPVFLYCGLIIYMSSLSNPSRDLPSFFSGLNDKLVHGVEYGILGILFYRAWHQITQTRSSIGLAIICTVAFGISDELHQWFVPNRHADIWDLLADAVGGTFCILSWSFLTEKYCIRKIQPHEGM